MSTAILGSSTALARTLAEGLGAHLCGADTVSLPQDTTGVVIVVGADPMPHESSTGSASDEDWRRLTEEPMRRTLVALQRSWSVMAGRGGRIVLVTPNIGMVGARHLVPYTTALEGIRAMTKSAARQWASSSDIVVNTIAAPLPLFAPDMRGSAGHLTAAAVPDDDNLVRSIISTLEFLLHTDSRHVVGATILVDGGALMLP